MMMTYELGQIEELVYGRDSDDKREAAPACPPVRDEIIFCIRDELPGIQQKIRKTVYGYPEEGLRILYVQQHQHGLTRLINRVFDDYSNSDRDIDLKSAPLLGLLSGLLDFLRDEFPLYFNTEAAISKWHKYDCLRGLAAESKLLQMRLAAHGCDQSLEELVIKKLQCACPQRTLTYNCIRYRQQLIKGLEVLDSRFCAYSCFPLLVRFFIYWNFNAPGFVNYLIQYVREEAELGDNCHKKTEILSFYFKETRQLPMRAGACYEPAQPTVKDGLLCWLTNEIEHFKEYMPVPAKNALPVYGNQQLQKDEGLNLQFTVEEMGMLLKALKETGLLTNKSMKEVAQRVAGRWRSKNKEHISWQYLYNAMSGMETGTARNLEDKLMEMAKWVRKRRG